MTKRFKNVACGVLIAAVGAIVAREHLQAQVSQPVVVAHATATQGATAPNNADTEAIQKVARAFAEAFNKGDAKAIAAMWTENGECREADGETFRGRAAIEKAYAEFFKKNAGAKLEVMVKSIRFPAKDLAIEEGLLRQASGAKTLPASTSYVAIHIRESGQWKIALSSEAGAGDDRLDDLDWLIGTWSGKSKDGEMNFSFVKDTKKPVIVGTFTTSATGKDSVTHTVRIALDPETGHLRSWCFEDDGAHSQSLWHNDGKSWLLETRGVLANGTPTSETIVIHRVGPDAITWRFIDRVLDDQPLPDTKPLRLTRSK